LVLHSSAYPILRSISSSLFSLNNELVSIKKKY